MSKKKPAGSASRRTENKFLVNTFMNFSLTEAYNTARTNIMFSLATKKKKTVAVTSYSPADGKSSTVTNLALTFAKTEAKVLLIDADMRKPSIQPLLKIKNSHGLSTLISGLCSVESAINHDVEENLDVICAGPIPPNPAELLSSPYMAELLTEFQSKYDFIFIDTPPISLVSDSLLLNNLISGIVFVIRENSTRHPEIRNAIDSIKLANGRILGFVKVSCKVKKHRYGVKRYGYYKYGAYYGYNGNSTSKNDSKAPVPKKNQEEPIKKDKPVKDEPVKFEKTAPSIEKSSPAKEPKPAKPNKKAKAPEKKSLPKVYKQPPAVKETPDTKKNKGFESIITSNDLDDILSSVSADIDRYKNYLSDDKK